MLKIYNTLTRSKEVFTPISPPKVGFYQCGMTVYDLCHIGHARTCVVFDVITRYLRYQGYDVFFVRNITDIDDKIIHRAQALNIDWQTLVAREIEHMNEDLAKLQVQLPDAQPRATEHIPEIIDLIEKLIHRGHAYQAQHGDVLYAVESFPAYGRLSRQALEQLQSGARVEVDNHKHNPLDFVLWKQAKPGEPSWDSPWGVGRPGWHIECSAMNQKLLGDHFDIHAGGSDLIFPHHENEIAQSCGACDTPYVNTWMHSGMVTIEQEKMSKSLGNFFTIRDVLKHYDPETLRFFLISGHYRGALNYSDTFLQQARAGLERFYTVLRDVPASDDTYQLDPVAVQAFTEAMDDDFNTPEALAVLFQLAKTAQSEKQSNLVKAQSAADTLKALGAVLGILQQAPEQFLHSGEQKDCEEIERLIASREQARAAKDWAKADAVRDTLLAKGILLEDSPEGTRWRRH